jgi:hypothetical protein
MSIANLGTCPERLSIVGTATTRRAYVSWNMFIEHQFNPHADLKRNSYGVLEFSGNKPDLERMFDNYLRDREEDSNIIG